MGEQVAARVPDQLLAGQPAEALHIAALDLAAVDARQQRAADVVQDVDAQHPVLTSQARDLDLGQRGAIRKVVKRLAAPELAVVNDARRRVITDRGQRDAAGPRGAGELGEAGAAAAGGKHLAVGEHDLRGVGEAEQLGGERAQALAQLGAGALDRGAVEVRATRGSGRGGVGDLVGRGRHHADLRLAHAELVGADRQHFAMQALAHLGAAVVELHAAVRVDQHERAGLVEHGVGERDAELDRHEAEAALDVRRAGIERVDVGPAPDVLGLL